MSDNKVRVRFAPSPTGTLHIGGARTALFNYLFARKYNGTFILRIEDTDLARSTEESMNAIKRAMKWMNMDWDEGPDKGGEFGPYIQTQRKDTYRKYLDMLIEKGYAYKCYCTPEELQAHREKMEQEKKDPIYSRKCLTLSKEDEEKYEKEGRKFTYRFKMPDKKIVVEDLVFGRVEYDANLLTDLIIWKSDDVPTYNFAVVIDDYEMKITHVLRGEGHFQNTPSQVAIYDALELPTPKFAHLSTILGENKKKLSKRDGAVSVEEFQKLGYLPEALTNFIALLGWGPEDNEEFMTIQELCEKFDINRVTKSPAVFNTEKLNHFNSQYLNKAEVEDVYETALEYYKEAGLVDDEKLRDENFVSFLKKTMKAGFEPVTKISELPENTTVFFNDDFEITSEDAMAHLKTDTAKLVLDKLVEKLPEYSELPSENIKKLTKDIQKELKEQKVKGKLLFMPIRVALSGSVEGHGVYALFEIIGPERCKTRVENCLKKYFN